MTTNYNVLGIFKELEDDAVKVQGFAREVVAKRTAITGALTSALLLLTNYGFNFSDSVNHWLDVVFVVLGFVANIGLVRPVVTPVTSPRTNEGEMLVPVSTAKAAVAEVATSNVAEAGDFKAFNPPPLGDAGLNVTPK